MFYNVIINYIIIHLYYLYTHVLLLYIIKYILQILYDTVVTSFVK